MRILSSRAHRIAVLSNMVETYADENTGGLLKLIHGDKYDQWQRDILVARQAIAELQNTGQLEDSNLDVREVPE